MLHSMVMSLRYKSRCIVRVWMRKNDIEWFAEKCGENKFKRNLVMKFGNEIWNHFAFEKLTAKIWLKSNGMFWETEHQHHHFFRAVSKSLAVTKFWNVTFLKEITNCCSMNWNQDFYDLQHPRTAQSASRGQIALQSSITIHQRPRPPKTTQIAYRGQNCLTII